MADSPLIAITAGSAGNGLPTYRDAIERAGALPWPLTPDYGVTPEEALERAGALVLSDGPAVNPARYGQSPNPEIGPVTFDDARDEMEIALVRAGLDADLPIYGIGRGMHILNVALGGELLQSSRLA